VLKASHQPAANGRVAVTLCVADTGIGIAPVAQEKIFEQFLQADGSTTRRYGGTGLGLAISRRLVEKMGGLIRVESTAGFGSRFYVELELPAANGAVAHPKSAEALAGGDAPVQMPLQGAVLLVEDNPINQMVATAMLEKLGVTVTLADDGVAAIEKVKAGRYDLVLMDCQMPVMDGYQATAIIRADTAVDPHLHIIAVTANTMPGDDEKCRAAGMNDVLAKPFSLQQLRGTLERWLPPPVQRCGDTAARASA
jgi:CheY-like chemotaxis protein